MLVEKFDHAVIADVIDKAKQQNVEVEGERINVGAVIEMIWSAFLLVDQQASTAGEGLIIQKFRKKPVVIEAVQYWGDNLREVLDFTGKHPSFDQYFSSFDEYAAHVARDRQAFKIITLEGTMEAFPGDWIIKGVKGEFYPCKPDIFAATYEAVE